MLVADVDIKAGVASVAASPRSVGTLDMIVVRPEQGTRRCPDQVLLSVERGLEGDRWLTTSWLRLPDGTPDPRVQLTLMNTRILRLLAVDPQRMALAGDNLVVDLDVGEENLPVGQRVAIGNAVIEVTEVLHAGCAKFLDRYGRDAVKCVNAPEGRRQRLRGLYARIVSGGLVRVGDTVRKV